MQPLLVVGREQEQVNHNLPLRLGQAGLHGRAEQLIAGPALRAMVRGVDRVTLRLDELQRQRNTAGRPDQLEGCGHRGVRAAAARTGSVSLGLAEQHAGTFDFAFSSSLARFATDMPRGRLRS